MKRLLLALSLSLLLTSCHRTSREAWEDTKTAGRYVNKGFSSLLGRHGDHSSRPLAAYYQESGRSFTPSDFIPLADDERYSAGSFYVPSESPGDPGSSLPGIDGFRDPQGKLAELFKLIHFETDSYTIRGENNLLVLETIAEYLTDHTDVYVFVEGHADERGSASYNLALGAKRSNAVRDYLMDMGVSPDQLFTISYGKERPIAFGHDDGAWNANRRAAFKLYER